MSKRRRLKGYRSEVVEKKVWVAVERWDDGLRVEAWMAEEDESAHFDVYLDKEQSIKFRDVVIAGVSDILDSEKG